MMVTFSLQGEMVCSYGLYLCSRLYTMVGEFKSSVIC
uniref:Uncharacterized protein n=1 Tax=Arundo donax TaxID=35708 RepID=A0A0A8Y975_ARUDO